MKFFRNKTGLHSAIATLALFAATSANASFVAAIDSFSITKNGGAFFTDTFSDNVAPPSVPAGNGSLTYSVLGTGQTETGGKLYMDSALGSYALAGDGTARLRNIDTVLSNTDPQSSLGLKPGSTFAVSGLFDLVGTPVARDLFGIALKDTTGGVLGQPLTGHVWSLDVGRNGAGNLGIFLIHQDYTANTISITALASLDSSHDQIMLQFDRDNTGSSLAHASFQYWDGGVANGGFTSLGDATIFQSQQWVRADYHTNQETPVIDVPEPASLALVSIGLLGLARRRKTAA